MKQENNTEANLIIIGIATIAGVGLYILAKIGQWVFELL
jgi:hypothetical protein